MVPTTHVGRKNSFRPHILEKFDVLVGSFKFWVQISTIFPQNVVDHKYAFSWSLNVAFFFAACALKSGARAMSHLL